MSGVRCLTRFPLWEVICVLAFLVLVPCRQAMAQGTVQQKTFDSFCGFKAGDDKQKCKTRPRNNKLLDESFVGARKPFRKFKDVRLTFKTTS